MDQPLEPVHEKLLVDDHYYGRQYHLHQTHRDVIAFKEGRERPAPHSVAHREVHEDYKKAKRPYEALLKDWSLSVLEGGLIGGKAAACRIMLSAVCLETRAVTRVGDSPYYILRRGASFYTH